MAGSAGNEHVGHREALISRSFSGLHEWRCVCSVWIGGHLFTLECCGGSLR